MDNLKKLTELLASCTVRLAINQSNESDGTGFFVAPRLILTCAHVVEKASQENTAVKVTWKNNEYIAKIKYMSSTDYPDIALLQVDHNFPHPCVYLHQEISPEDRLYCFGYPLLYPQGDPATFVCEGITGSPRELLKFKSGEARQGFSGGPLLNERTGGVCGLMKLTRGTDSQMGGRGVPTRTIFTLFPELRDQQEAFHAQNSQWNDAQSEQQRQLVNVRKEISLFFHAGGPVPPHAACYIQRAWPRSPNLSLELQARNLISAGRYLTVLGPRQIGKTSLLYKLQEDLNKRAIPCAFIDLSPLQDYIPDTPNPKQSADIWYDRLAASIYKELKSATESYHDKTVKDKHTFISFLNNMSVIAAPDSKVVIMFDEAAAVPGLLRVDFFASLRALFSSRHSYKAGAATRITFVFAGAFNPSTLITDPTISPFNVATNIDITDFTHSEVDRLLQGFTQRQISLKEGVGDEIWQATQGHPFLTQKICQNLELTSQSIISTQDVSNEITNILHHDPHLQNLIRQLSQSTQETAMIKRVLSGQKIRAIANQTGAQLEMLGVLKVGQDGCLYIRNGIYEQLFRDYFANQTEI